MSMGAEHETGPGTNRSDEGSRAEGRASGTLSSATCQTLSTHGAPPRLGRGAPLDPRSLTSLQRQVGNRAVTASLQRQHAGDESAPVEIPASGPAADLTVVFSSGGQLTFDMGDLSEFGLGEGVLETPEIPVGEVISVKAAMGSQSPVTLDKPTLTLSPVVGTISAAEVAKYRAEQASSDETRSTVGSVAAGVGGIVGGIVGGVVGGAVGSAVGPAGTIAGGAAAGKWGAEQGGAAAGAAADWLFDAFRGDFDLTAHLDQGEITGALGLHYEPFVRLSLGVTGFQWLASISAELLTKMDMAAATTIGLAGSNVVLHFSDGRLQRTNFTLAPAASLNLDLVAEARLRLVGSLLNILEDTAGRDQPVLSGSYTSEPFHLFSVGGAIDAQTSFEFSKGSRMSVLEQQITAATGGVRDQFTAGLRGSGRSMPFVKRRLDLDEMSRTGESKRRPILMDWHKPSEWYPRSLTRPSPDGRGEEIRMYPHKVYDNGLAMGVSFWPGKGTTLEFRGGEEPKGGAVAQFKRELQEEGIDLEGDLAYKADIDHVVDWAFSGPDDATNLWPLESGANRSAGVTQNRQQKVWWAKSDAAEPQKTAIEEVPRGRWFVIDRVRNP